MSFEWDEAKRQQNLAKHGVDFVDATRMFGNPILERIDDREDYGEERLIAIGHWDTDVFVVAYTWRGENRRIIAAWKAGKNDQREYYATVYG